MSRSRRSARHFGCAGGGNTTRIKDLAGQNGVGKFGWKAQVATVFDFAGDAKLASEQWVRDTGMTDATPARAPRSPLAMRALAQGQLAAFCSFCDFHFLPSGIFLKNSQALPSPSSFQRNQGIET